MHRPAPSPSRVLCGLVVAGAWLYFCGQQVDHGAMIGRIAR